MDSTAGHQPYTSAYYDARAVWLDRRVEADLLLRHAKVGRGARLLDVGCGDGVLLARAVAGGGAAVGVEVNADALRAAKARAPGASVVATGGAASLPFADAVFDAVVSQHVLEHLDDPVAHLREWRRVARPGAYLALVTPNRDFPDPSHFADPDHRHIWTASEIAAAFDQAGWSAIRLWSVFPYLGRSRAGRALSVRIGALLAPWPIPGGHGRSLVAVARRVRESEELRSFLGTGRKVLTQLSEASYAEREDEYYASNPDGVSR